MNVYTIIAGVNGTGKSSFRGVLEGQNVNLGHIIDPDMIAADNNGDLIRSARLAVSRIKNCLKMNVSFTQETTLSGRSVLGTVEQARRQGYYISLYYIGLSSAEESLSRIANRVRKGGHDIPKEDVIRRFSKRFDVLRELLPYCDTVSFYDNENGFVKVAEMTNCHLIYTADYKPSWLIELAGYLKEA